MKQNSCRHPNTAACNAFEADPNDQETFVSKTYLTKSLLEHVLQMELLPPIEDATDSKIR